MGVVPVILEAADNAESLLALRLALCSPEIAVAGVIADFDLSVDSVRVSGESALIGEIAAEQPGPVTVVAFGPLTRIAEAFRADPGLPRSLRELIVWGGGGERTEANFAQDPQAASEVFGSGVNLACITRDVSAQANSGHGAALTLTLALSMPFVSLRGAHVTIGAAGEMALEPPSPEHHANALISVGVDADLFENFLIERLKEEQVNV